MRGIWKWLTDNAAALGSIAAISVIAASLLAAAPYFSRAISSDLLIRTNVDKSTLPPEFSPWLRELSFAVSQQEREVSSQSESQLQISSLLDEPFVETLQYAPKSDKMIIEIINQSEKIITDLFARIDNINTILNIQVSGTFLQLGQEKLLETQILGAYRDQSIVFPDLPPLPPESVLQVTLYGDLSYSDLTISSVGTSFSISNIIETEDSWILFWYENPFFILIFGFSMLPIFLTVGAVWWQSVHRRVLAAGKPSILYDAACHAAANNKLDESIVLLRSAIDAGYTNKKHARADPDLKPIRGRPEFTELFGEDQ